MHRQEMYQCLNGKALVKDYTGEDYDNNIPAIGSKIDAKKILVKVI